MTASTATRPTLTTSYCPADTSRPLQHTTVGDLLRHAADTVPDRIALVDGVAEADQRRRWTYRELLERSEQVAAVLLDDFQTGDRLAVWDVNSAEWVQLQMGAALAGIVLVTINPQYRADELRYALRQSGSVGIVHGDAPRGESMADVIKVVLPDVPDLRRVIAFADWDSLVQGGAPDVLLPTITPEDESLIIYTSGTTGYAKGALLHQLGVCNVSRLTAERSNFRDGDVWINPIPLFHTGGGVLGSLGALAMRGTQVVVPQFDPELVLDLIENEGGNLIVTVPTILMRMLDHPDRPSRDLSSLRTIMCGGTKVPAELVRRTKDVIGCDFSILFGQAEMHGVLTQTFPIDSDADQAETLGAPLVHVEVKIADGVTGEPVPLGVSGEICARGYQNMLGYFHMEEATAATIDSDGWLHSGDMGTMDHRGYVRISGRLKDLIIRGGENIHPLEVEERLLGHSAVAEVAVIGVPDAEWGEQVAAVIRVSGDTDPDVDDLKAYCREALAPFKTPRVWYFVNDFPMTASGKIQKFVLRQRADSGDLGASSTS